MARRKMRRKNPMRSTGMLVVNPRRRVRRKRRNTTKREMRYLWSRPKRTTRRRTTRATTALRTNRRRRNTRRGGRRTTARRAFMRTNRRRNTRRGGRRTTARRAYMRTNRRRRNTRRGGRRSTARRAYMRTNRRRRNTHRRRNPSVAQSIAKIPFIGKPLAMMWGFLPTAAIGAVSVEPLMMLVRLLGPIFGDRVNASVIYGLLGLGLATVVQYLPIKDKSFRDKLSVAVASAAGGVAFYKWRMGMDNTAAQETGLLQLHGAGNGFGALELFPGPLNGAMGALELYPGPLNGYGDGMAYSVNPYPGAISNGAF